MLRTFGEDSMEEARLESSILGSIIPTLDPDPPDPARNNAFMSPSYPSGAGSERPLLPSPAPDDASVPGTPVPGEAGVAASTGGGSGVAMAAASIVAGRGGVGGVGAMGAVHGGAGRQEVGVVMARTRKPRVKHGLRVLLRGTSR